MGLSYSQEDLQFQFHFNQNSKTVSSEFQLPEFIFLNKEHIVLYDI